ncbi:MULTISPECIES: MFS transporter [unclassified Paraburkholderia]|uniref:MFS transporter n=1 Tax=unclassified Paraburkholderia TaxID=2615204 RepID=UPI002AB1E5C5|nr:MULTISPECIES: MFS transporter [unclassified Paraburkholderia]
MSEIHPNLLDERHGQFPSDHAASATTPTISRRAIAAAAIGNGLEAYDFTLYSFFAATIGHLYFPASDPTTSLLLSFATFGAGFVMRPLGAVLIGNLADRRGRKSALSLTIALMTAGTAVIALTPTYASIGVIATVLMVLGRLLQGLSAGGEIGTASALLLESASKGRRCYFVSWQTATQGAAALLGALSGLTLHALLPADEVATWGWRLPFLMGLFIAPVGLYIRRHLPETQIENHGTALDGIREVVSGHWRTLLLGILMMTSSTTSVYVSMLYMPTYLVRTLHMPPITAYACTAVSGLTMLVLAPLFGRLADRLRRRKPLVIINCLISLVIGLPSAALIVSGPGLPVVLMCVVLSGTLMSMSAGAGPVLMMEAFPRKHRAAGMSMMYSFGVTIFGAFAPLAVTWLIGATGSPMAPAFYQLSALLITFAALLLYPGHPDRA